MDFLDRQFADYMHPAIPMALAILIDLKFGEFRRWHPLVGFGKLAGTVEHWLHGSEALEEAHIITRLKGVLAVIVTCAPFVALAYRLMTIQYIGPILNIFILYLAVGAKSLGEHALAVFDALDSGDINLARAKVSRMVSRDTGAMTPGDITRAAIESVLENGNDAIFGTLFWFLLGGAPGVVLYRLVNTLDAMWGYKNTRYLYFGWAAARLDDVLNWIPARLTALTYALVGSWQSAWSCWLKQGRTWYSPNAGPVLAAGAGALELQLGGPAIYHGALKDRPLLGEGRQPEIHDIDRSIELVQKGICLWIIVALAGLFIHA